MTIEDIQGRRYAGFGRCIYCGSSGESDGLRDEHIIPLSLGGKAVIEKASCPKCEAITSYIDGYLGRGIFFEYRAHVGAPTRRPKKRPTAFPAHLILNGVAEIRQFVASEHPYFLAMPIWGLPTILQKQSPSPNFAHHKCHIYEFIPPNIRDTLGIDPDVSVQVRGTGSINYDTFARALAKIGYCHTVLRYGLDGFEPLDVPKLILGEYACASHYVGVPLDNPPPPAPKGQLHIINFEPYTDGDIHLISVSIRLFAHSGADEWGMPIYRVVSGAYKI